MDHLPSIDVVCRKLDQWEKDIEELTQIVKKAREIDTKMKTHNPDDSEYISETSEEAYQRAVNGSILEEWVFEPRQPDQKTIACLIHASYWPYLDMKKFDQCKG